MAKHKPVSERTGRSIEANLSRPYLKQIKPQIGPQEAFLSSPADIVIFGGAAGGGKCLLPTEPVLTPSGWVEIGKLVAGDEVCVPAGGTARVSACYQQKDKQLYKLVFADQTEVVCSGDHLWKSWTINNGPRSTKLWRADDLFERYQKTKERNRIPLIAEPSFHPTLDLPIDPYVLGCLLGDGCFVQNGTVGLTSADPELVERFYAKLGQPISAPFGNQKISYWVRGIWTTLRDLGLIGQKSAGKFIPQDYLFSGAKQRLELLRGLLDTDGFADDRGVIFFTSVSALLADGVEHLARSLGAYVTRHLKHTFYKSKEGVRIYGQPSITLRIKRHNGAELMTLPRKVARLEGKTYQSYGNTIVAIEKLNTADTCCIAVDHPDHLFITRNFVVTHNTYGMLLEPLRHVTNNPEFSAVFFRRNTVQVKNPGGLWDESMKLYPLAGGQPVSHVLEWRWAKGGKIKMAHLDHEDTVFDWQGSQIPLILFDELTHFSQTQFFYMMSRNRSMCGVKPYIRASTNPDADSWVATFIEWWIDQDSGLPIYERGGVIRWFIRLNDSIIWGDSKQDLVDRYGRPDLPEDDELQVRPKSVTFIPAKLSDNKALLAADPDYKANLLAMSRVERERLLHGNWKIRPAAGLYFKRSDVTIVDIIPDDIEKTVRRWDLAATEVAESNPDPDWSAGVKMARRKNGRYIVLDVVHERKRSHLIRELVKRVAGNDTRKVRIGISQDPGQAGKEQAESYVRELAGFIVDVFRETGDKITRGEPFAAQWQAGNVDVLRAPWNEAYFAELEAFGGSKGHDDMVDGSAGAFSMLVGTSMSTWAKLGGK